MKKTMHSIKDNYQEILNNVETAANNFNQDFAKIKVLAVSKTHTSQTIIEGINSGIQFFAENYAQEFRDKHKEVEKYYLDNNMIIPNFEWHFIGHLQTNKVKYIVPFVTTIHTIDCFELANAVNSYSAKCNKKINVLLQINTSGEQSKSGIEPNKCIELAKQILPMSNLNLIGLMTIGTFANDELIIRKEFTLLRNCLNDINKQCGTNLAELSMGMSHDYKIAIEEKATMLRIGTSIFGHREYSKKE
jgi:pyridoxal phosphate enzyme (YggS family)